MHTDSHDRRASAALARAVVCACVFMLALITLVAVLGAG